MLFRSRKKSMLRGEYKPMKDDGVGEGSDRVEGPSRLNFEELTISDLQRLEQLAGAPSLPSHCLGPKR